MSSFIEEHQKNFPAPMLSKEEFERLLTADMCRALEIAYFNSRLAEQYRDPVRVSNELEFQYRGKKMRIEVSTTNTDE
jgi:hypothetical protein